MKTLEQRLHDYNCYWNENGLNKVGKGRLTYINNNYNLSLQPRIS